jgi:hypothetical protein
MRLLGMYCVHTQRSVAYLSSWLVYSGIEDIVCPSRATEAWVGSDHCP